MVDSMSRSKKPNLALGGPEPPGVAPAPQLLGLACRDQRAPENLERILALAPTVSEKFGFKGKISPPPGSAHGGVRGEMLMSGGRPHPGL